MCQSESIKTDFYPIFNKHQTAENFLFQLTKKNLQMSQRNSEKAKKEGENINNFEIEGPGPPEAQPSAGESGSSPIDQWVHALRDDIYEIVVEILESDIEEARDKQKKIEEAKVEDWTVSKICEELKNGRFKNIVVFTGAGISTSAGIPGTFITILWFLTCRSSKFVINWISDFRTPGTGLYDNLQAYNLDKPEDIFSLDFFKTNPKPFYTLAKEIMPGKFSPTISHHFIAMLEEKGNFHFNKTRFYSNFRHFESLFYPEY